MGERCVHKAVQGVQHRRLGLGIVVVSMRNQEGRRRLLLGILGTFIAAVLLRYVPSVVLMPALTESGMIHAGSGLHVLVANALLVLAEISAVACGLQVAAAIVGWARIQDDDFER